MNKEYLQEGFNKMLGVDTIIRRKRLTQKNQKRNLFLDIIKKYDEELNKSLLLETNFQIDISKFNDPLYHIIDNMILLSWGEDVSRLISFYFYERFSEDGNPNFMIGPNLEEIFIESPEELYDVIIKLFPNTFD